MDLAFVAGSLVAQSDDTTTADTLPQAASTTSAPPTTAVSLPAEVAFPPGYEPITDLVAVKPTNGLEAHDTLFIAIDTAVRRGFEPSESAPFQSGRWSLETASGETLTSQGTVYDTTVPGTFSIVLPLEGRTEVIPTRLILLERWARDDWSSQ